MDVIAFVEIISNVGAGDTLILKGSGQRANHSRHSPRAYCHSRKWNPRRREIRLDRAQIV